MERYRNISMKFIMLLGICFIATFLHPDRIAYAATPVTINSVLYSDESILVNNNGNSRIYFATESEAAKDNWDVIEADSGVYTMIDMSWLSPIVQNIIMIKGEENKTPTRVIFNEKPQKLEVSFNYEKINSLQPADTIALLVNIMTTEGTGENPINFSDLEWKKGAGGDWNSSSTFTFALLQKFLIKGTYITFRIAAVDDKTIGTNYADGTDGRRCSNEIKVKVAKTSAPMVVGIDGSKFTADIKYGKEYRVTTYNGTVKTTTDWIKVIDRAVRTLPLATIINNGTDGTIGTKVFPVMMIEIRDYASAKAAASKITEISLNAQRVLAGTIIEGDVPSTSTSSDPNLYIAYNGIKNIILTIPSASADRPYEYCFVKLNSTFDLSRAVWTSITKSTATKILSSKASEGATMYVRQKEIKSKPATTTAAAVSYALASTYLTKQIIYPSNPVIAKESFTFTKGYSSSIIINVTLNVTGKKPFETAIKNIRLGTKEIGFSYTVSPTIDNPINLNQVYTMKITLNSTSLETMTNSYGRALSINYANGTVDKTSVKLTIQNPTVAPSLTATAAKGTVIGETKITLVNTAGTGNVFVYSISDTAVTGKNTQDIMSTGTAFTSGAGIAITANKYLTIYEINSTTKNIVKYKCILITSDFIL